MVGTGLPDALHSSVTVLPFRAATWPFCGTARSVGGTEHRHSSNNTHTMKIPLRSIANPTHLTQYLHCVHLVTCLLVANLTDVVAGILRPNAADLQIVVADDLEARVARDLQMARCQNGGAATPQQHKGAWMPIVPLLLWPTYTIRAILPKFCTLHGSSIVSPTTTLYRWPRDMNLGCAVGVPLSIPAAAPPSELALPLFVRLLLSLMPLDPRRLPKFWQFTMPTWEKNINIACSGQFNYTWR